MATHWDEPGATWDDGSTWDEGEAVGNHKMAKIKLDLSHMNVPVVISYLRTIAGKMTGNTKFTSLATDVTALATAVTTLETSNTDYDKAVKTSSELLTVRNDNLAVVTDLAHKLANGTEKITGDAAELQSGGWELVADRTPVGQLHPPANLHATGGDVAGSVDLGWDPQRGVQTHIVQWSTAPTGPWNQGYIGKKSTCTVTGLASGTEHWFRAQASGAAGQSDWSGPISKRAS